MEDKLYAFASAASSGILIYLLATGEWTGWGWAALAAVEALAAFGLVLRAMLAEIQFVTQVNVNSSKPVRVEKGRVAK